jgi:hypothetical protein
MAYGAGFTLTSAAILAALYVAYASLSGLYEAVTKAACS